jgi:predicted nucleic acid-binding protein
MVCFDTNVVIYLGNQTLGEDVIGAEPIYYASISRVEALGYPDILAAEEQRIKELFDVLIEVPLNTSVIQTAIRLRQLKKMSLGDAVIAATALENNCVLWTANVDDFAHIDGLHLYNPLKV